MSGRQINQFIRFICLVSLWVVNLAAMPGRNSPAAHLASAEALPPTSARLTSGGLLAG